MGRVAKWFRSLFTSKKPPGSSPANHNNKNKWPLSDPSHTSINFKNYEEDPFASPYVNANKHARAVAAATAAVAEAALAAAQAAAQVVRLTSGAGSGRTAPYVADRRSLLAAVKIQSAFRAYLARRALRALRGLVKLQALVRGRIVRKQSADMLYRMQTMARIQARASAHRSESSDQGMGNLGKNEERSNSVKHGASLLKHSRTHSVKKENSHLASRWLNHWMEQCAWNNLHETSIDNDERNDKILEVDTWKPHQKSSEHERPIPTSHYFSAWKNEHSKIGPSRLQKPNPSISSEEARTADNSPRVHSASSRPSSTSNLRGPFTPARTEGECSRSVYGDYLGHPSYMANTQSSRAKVRSHSAPKQRTQYEELGLSSKYGCDPWDLDTISEKASLPANTYLYSGLVKRQGTPQNNAAVPVGVHGRTTYR